MEAHRISFNTDDYSNFVTLTTIRLFALTKHFIQLTQ